MKAYNPLDKRNLAGSIVNELLRKPAEQLPAIESFNGAGIYVIYYRGPFEAYATVAAGNADGRYDVPIYVGKAASPGGRVGGHDFESAPGTELYKRIAEHADSIRQAENLELNGFTCRYLVVDDIFIPLAESLLIGRYRPV